jgi:hypothetical protein
VLATFSRILTIRSRTPQKSQKSLQSQFGQKCDHNSARNSYEPIDAELLDDAIPKPLPLGAMTKHIQELAASSIAVRSIEYYESLAAQKAANNK